MPDVIAMLVTGLMDGGSLAEILSLETAWSCAKWWATAHIAREALAWVRA